MSTLIVITGPTGSGKTALALDLAERLRCDIINADSRQVYAGIPVATAAPTEQERRRVRHHLLGVLPLDAYYSAAQFETDVMALLPGLFAQSDYAVMCGGSMMYVDAVTRGIDQLPTVPDHIREQAWEVYRRGGLEALRAILGRLDPAYLAEADPDNHKRLVHALEICMAAGVPYSSLRTGRRACRPFKIVKMAIAMPREVLFDRINRRVDAMIEAGMEQEAQRVYPQRHLNSLNTVGLKEWFAVFDGTLSRTIAPARIAKNTRVYAKKQLTWLRRDNEIKWLDAQQPLLPQALRILNLEE